MIVLPLITISKTKRHLKPCALPPKSEIRWADHLGIVRIILLRDMAISKQVKRLKRAELRASLQRKAGLRHSAGILGSRRFYWNSSMFCWQLSTIMDAFETHQPQLYQTVEKIADMAKEGFDADISELYKEMPRTRSIRESWRSREALLHPVDLGWSDVGSWKALSQLASKTKIKITQVRDHRAGCKTTISIATTHRHHRARRHLPHRYRGCAAICPKERSEDVRHIVDIIKERGLNKLL